MCNNLDDFDFKRFDGYSDLRDEVIFHLGEYWWNAWADGTNPLEGTYLDRLEGFAEYLRVRIDMLRKLREEVQNTP